VRVSSSQGFATGATLTTLFHFFCSIRLSLGCMRVLCSRLAMLALCKVHAAGVMHNSALHLRHFVMKGKRVLLVDFALARVHQCENAHPVLLNQGPRPAVVTEHCQSECSELIVAERSIFSQIGELLPMKIPSSSTGSWTAIAL
jgi:hypothetical protein